MSENSGSSAVGGNSKDKGRKARGHSIGIKMLQPLSHTAYVLALLKKRSRLFSYLLMSHHDQTLWYSSSLNYNSATRFTSVPLSGSKFLEHNVNDAQGILIRSSYLRNLVVFNTRKPNYAQVLKYLVLHDLGFFRRWGTRRGLIQCLIECWTRHPLHDTGNIHSFCLSNNDHFRKCQKPQTSSMPSQTL